jgi:hypothetical protein
MKADEVYARLRNAQPPKFIPFRDAAMGPSTYDLQLHDVLRAVEKVILLYKEQVKFLEGKLFWMLRILFWNLDNFL